MITGLIQIRKARHCKVCALVLSCFLLPAAYARQASTGTAAQAPSTKKTATGKTTVHHKPSASATKPSSKTHTASGKRSSRKKSTRSKGQQKIDSERAQAIQEALIREHYLSGEATGTWNQASEEAMRRYQADHGWQSKTVPDSRALIKLGLGPSKDHLLNPESAMTTVPDAPRAEPMSTTSHSAPPSADPAPPAPVPQQNESPSPQ
jgi:hypothetical protein